MVVNLQPTLIGQNQCTEQGESKSYSFHSVRYKGTGKVHCRVNVLNENLL